MPDIHDNEIERQKVILCIHGFRQHAKGLQGRTRSLEKKLKRANIVLTFVDGPHVLPWVQKDGTVVDIKSNRRAWMVSESQYASIKRQDGDISNCWVDMDEQYRTQVAGWEESKKVIDGVLDTNCIDCLFGFSQGAAVVGVMAGLESERPVQQRRFKCAVMASGYVPTAQEPMFQRWLSRGGINIPSMHIYGDDSKDKQVQNAESERLMDMFEQSQVRAMHHNRGHLIPSSKEEAAELIEFLETFASTKE